MRQIAPAMPREEMKSMSRRRAAVPLLALCLVLVASAGEER